ncbi:DUF3192 domain-containing protein [Pseudoalteromonas luteoviolacea]|uniref:DUF3192 domain-containing protein n=1 Tax=Pseudoalteromonas luteoviolacea TaxID=43657 RepID=UPI001B3A6ED3|nr:DUF3192 domain-containing protein [Pseudoalteromonas luteoviolacea]MBQ4876287.1 DUF3192 domain-containing protein [Pseudoalteromonas luteoviolacea]MBQ4906320.1 DUF3192 domain-containing protein [Pseudoalteromonas luteoviolacea]
MKKLLVATALLSTTLLSGCIVAVSDGEVSHHSAWNSTHKENRAKISKLELGSSYQAVTSKFGTPDFNEAVSKDGHTYQVLFFATNRKHSDGQITKDECTPLVFKDDQLIGFGQAAVDNYL